MSPHISKEAAEYGVLVGIVVATVAAARAAAMEGPWRVARRRRWFEKGSGRRR